jgi:hypothetical protein
LSCSQLATRPRPVFIQPWGRDYWLFPGDEFEFTTSRDAPAPLFDVTEDDDATQIYLRSEGDDFAVRLRGQPLSGSFQRARLAGTISRAISIVGRGVVVVSDRPWLATFANGDQVRLIVPAIKTLSAAVRLELMNTGRLVNENPLGLFLGKLDIETSDIKPGSPLYRLD